MTPKNEVERAPEWGGTTRVGENPDTKYVVVAKTHYGFFTKAGAKAFLWGELNGEGEIHEVK